MSTPDEAWTGREVSLTWNTRYAEEKAAATTIPVSIEGKIL